MTKRRKVIVHIGLTSRPAPKGFYGMNAFTKSIDTKVRFDDGVLQLHYRVQNPQA